MIFFHSSAKRRSLVAISEFSHFLSAASIPWYCQNQSIQVLHDIDPPPGGPGNARAESLPPLINYIAASRNNDIDMVLVHSGFRRLYVVPVWNVGLRMVWMLRCLGTLVPTSFKSFCPSEPSYLHAAMSWNIVHSLLPLTNVHFNFFSLNSVAVPWLVVSTHLKKYWSKWVHLPQIGVKLINIWNHHLLLIDKILHHLGCNIPCKYYGINYLPTG